MTINQFLVEAGGGCWHEWIFNSNPELDSLCKKFKTLYAFPRYSPDFSKWENFGKLLEIAKGGNIQVQIMLYGDSNIVGIWGYTPKEITYKQMAKTKDIPRITAKLIAKVLGWKK